jgi:hypothetical protein
VGLSRSSGWYGLTQTIGRSVDLQLRAAQEIRALLILEGYINQANPQLDLLLELGTNISRRFPALAARTILGLAISQSEPYNYNDRPAEDFAAFVGKQIEYIRRTDPLDKMPGLAFWAFYRASPALVIRVGELLGRWYPR